MAVNTERSLINKAYPILKNFPFDSNFSIKFLENKEYAMVDSNTNQVIEIVSQQRVLCFTYNIEETTFSICIPEKEIEWINSASNSVKKLDSISKKLDKAIKSKNILYKLDISIESSKWMNDLTHGNTMLSKEILEEALSSIFGQIDAPESILLINNINKLYSKRGLVRLTKKEFSIIMTFIHFRLIYVKLILGIVIASKISI